MTVKFESCSVIERPITAGSTIEGALPKTIADHDDGGRANLVFVFAERAADLGICSDNIEEISGRPMRMRRVQARGRTRR